MPNKLVIGAEKVALNTSTFLKFIHIIHVVILDDESSNFKRSLIKDYIKHCSMILWANQIAINDEEDLQNSKTEAKPVTVEFTRQFVKTSKFPDELVLVLRNPFEMIISMQLKQASLASSDLKG